MQLLCEIFRKIINNSSQLHGVCYEHLPMSASLSSSSPKKVYTTHVPSKNGGYDKAGYYHLNRHGNANSKDTASNDYGAAIFIVVVICFYSLSIVFMVIFNIKFKFVFKNRSGFCCCDDAHNDLYESQKDETKNTINMIFKNSVVIPTSLILSNSAGTLLNSNEKIQLADLERAKSAQNDSLEANDDADKNKSNSRPNFTII
jgi:hypothetical protein